MTISTRGRGFVAVLAMALLVTMALPAAAEGNVQISGLGLPGAWGSAPCDNPDYSHADYVIVLEGDLEGCIYGFITEARFHEGSGTYQEVADEVFEGSWGALSGTFELLENFTAKFDPDTFEQIFGRCKHPIVADSGTGDFEGITGRLDFKDDVDAGNAPYTGHLKLGS